jgi:hypothetical protein
MRNFVYRAPRFPVDLLVQLTCETSTVVARCREISKNGMVLEALKHPLPKCSGMVALSHQGTTIELEVRIARSGPKWCGLEFIYKSEIERKELAHFVATVTETGNRPGPQLLV